MNISACIIFCINKIKKVQLFQKSRFILGEGLQVGTIAASIIIPLLLIMAIVAALFIKRKQVVPYVVSVYNKHGKTFGDIW